MDKSGANKVALEAYNEANDAETEIRQNKYLNNMAEQIVIKSLHGVQSKIMHKGR
jgi:transposase-like protein